MVVLRRPESVSSVLPFRRRGSASSAAEESSGRAGARRRGQRTTVAGARGAARHSVAPARTLPPRRGPEPAASDRLPRDATHLPRPEHDALHVRRLRASRPRNVQAHRGGRPVAPEPSRRPASPLHEAARPTVRGLEGDRPTPRAGGKGPPAPEPPMAPGRRRAVRAGSLTGESGQRKERRKGKGSPGGPGPTYAEDMPGAALSARIL